MFKIPVQIVGVLLFVAAAAFGQTASVTGGPLNFGSVPVGVTSTTLTLTVNNTGAAALDTIPTTPPAAAGAAGLTFGLTASPFSVSATSPGTCSAPAGTAAGGSCTINVVLTPTVLGAASDTLTIAATTGGGTGAVTVTGSPAALAGTGYEPSVSATSGEVSTVTLTNQSSTPLTFTLGALPAGFSVVPGGTCPAAIVVTSGSCTVAVQGPAEQSGSMPVTAASGTVNVTVLGSPVALGETGTGGPVETGLEQVVQLTAAPTSTTLPDGTVVPMWGYSCGIVVVGSTATCAKLNPNAVGWSPVVITVPSGKDLEIELTNSLSFTPIGTTTPNTIPTSLMIVGQVGGGLGTVASSCMPAAPTTAAATGATCTPSPDHSNAQSVYTWVSANIAGANTPPAQGPRVQSFATEVPVGTTADLIWKNPRPGTYLLESGTHPSIQVPMGLYGMLVVTCPPGAAATTCTNATAGLGTAYPAVAGTAPAPSYNAVTYNAEVPLEFSEIDPVQNNAVNTAVNTVGFSETAVWSAASTGPLSNVNIIYGGSGYLGGGSGTLPSSEVAVVGANGSLAAVSLTVTNGVITSAMVTNGGSGYSGTAPANIFVTDPTGTGAILTATTSPNAQGCGAPTVHTCYPPAVNYTPFYYAINGVAFNKTNPATSNFAVSQGTFTGTVTGTVLARLVNAGLRMHVPSIVGSQTTGFNGAGASATVGGFTLIAEDGNVVPNLLPNLNLSGQVAAPKVQTDVFMAAGKVYDVMINAPAAGTTSIPIYDRELSLSGNSSERDAGMLAYISVNGAVLPTFGTGVAGATVARADTYNSVVACAAAPCTPVVVSDVSKGVIGNDSFVYGVTLAAGPTGGTVSCGAVPGNSVPGSICDNGTFTYTPNVGTTSDSFQYCANGTTLTSSPSYCATVTLGAWTTGSAPDSITTNPITFTSKTAGYISIPPPGVLSVDSDSLGYPLSVVTNPAPTLTGCSTLSIQPNGGFILTAPAAATSCSFTYTAINSQGTTGTPTTATINFPISSQLQVTVLDGLAYKACAGDSTCIANIPPITDYRWIIEEDKTFYVNPACTATNTAVIAGCPQPTATTVPPTFGVNFHTSHMDYIAQGCTSNAPSDLSCEQGQTQQGVPVICEAGNGACVQPPPGTPAAWQPVLPSQVALDPGCGFGTFAGRTCGTGTGNTTATAPFPKRYYISVLPGDAANTFTYAYGSNPANCTPASGSGRSTTCGHGMGGGPISWNTSTNSWNPVIVLSEPNPYPPARLSVQVFEDDFPLNGEQDAGGGIDVLATNEPGLGGFELILFDDMGGSGDVTGQLTHDFFNQPLSNSLAGTVDPATGLDACPISVEITGNVLNTAGYATNATTTLQGGAAVNGAAGPNPQGALQGLSGRIVTCPRYESDGITLSPLAGQALVANMMPGRYSVQAYPGASRIARGEEWLQTNTLDGQHPHDSFLRIGEPSYFQEYGPAGYHVSIGFANPKIINSRLAAVCAAGGDGNVTGTNCTNTVTGTVTGERMSRPPDERLYSSGSRDAFIWTQCFVSLGDPDGEDFAFTKCDANGHFTFTSVPQGSWRLSIFDQWNDQLMDGLSTSINVCSASTGTCTANGVTINMGDVAVQQWQSNVNTVTCIDDNKNGICDPGELGIPLLNTTVRYRDGSRANFLVTDFGGIANFNETFPLFNWYVVEADTTRYKTTGIHTVYDAGGPANGTTCGGAYPACESGTPFDHLANTKDPNPLPGNLSVPGAIYCNTAVCTGQSIATGVPVQSSSTASTGRIDPPWVQAEGWQGFSGQFNFIEFAKAPYCAGNGTELGQCGATAPATAAENGGIQGHVVYTSTRAFDDPSLSVQQPWMPLVPNVTMNLYQESFAADGVTPVLKLVDTTQTSSFDKWAQGFRSDGVPYMNCPGQAPAPTNTTGGDPFFYTLFNQPNWLNLYDYYYSGASLVTLPNNSQFKCYDAMHNWNQLQPAVYDGMYQFPSVLGIIPSGASAGKLNTALTGGVGGNGLGTPGFTAAPMGGTNCTICIANPDATDPWRHNTPMLPPGKYVVEVIPPPGYELVKEEDKNILIGDNFIAPVYQQFGGLGNIYILPDQASVASMYEPSGSAYNATSAQDPTQSLGMNPNSNFVPGFLEPVWPCVGQLRQVPDYMSLFPEAREVASFAGAMRHMCDRKEVTLTNQMAVTAKFWIFTSTHIASKFAGVITDDFTSEFDPFAPVFGEKFAPPHMPVSTRDWVGNEISRVYSDQWGAFNGMIYSTWEVNPPNPTGYAPNMAVQCMNDKGPAIDFRPMITTSQGATIPNPTYGQLIGTDPLYNPLYSQFCYELSYMPGLTDYLDTPVVPTAAMVGAGYNNVDCDYPTNTPAISEVDSQDGIGPWVSAGGRTITITALGDQIVNNYGYSGPQATAPPYNQKTVTRHYGFGTTAGTVTIGGQAANLVGSWSDTTLTVTVPSSGVPQCAVQQQAQYRTVGGKTDYGTAYCGELVITAANGQQSIDTVNITIGGTTPTHVAASGSIQAAIDAAAPGDLIIVDPSCSRGNGNSPNLISCSSTGNVTKNPAAHRELVIMWKPVRLQGVGAASSIIDASTHPAGSLKLDPWRASVNCLFGLALNGQPSSAGNNFDPSGKFSCPSPNNSSTLQLGPDGNQWNYFYGGPNVSTMVVDRVPLEGILGWDATVNGNLAEQLQEPSLMGAYEGAGITVLAKGVNIPPGAADPFGSGSEASFPTGTTLLTGAVTFTGASPSWTYGDLNSLCTSGTGGTNPYPGNFMCNPSMIDGLGITDASQGGGAIFAHAWSHNLQIANNRVYNNAGTLSGGIVVGQGEFPEAYLDGTAGDTDPGSCFTPGGTTTGVFALNTQLPYCLQINVNLHHNMVKTNSSTGDELFTGTPAGAGGVSICTGSDYYQFNYNWVCGNISTGDGGGIGHLGLSWNGDIEHNTIQFNQATNPSIQANGGGLIIMGAAPDSNAAMLNGAECGSVTDVDCAPGLSDGTGPGLVINANVLEGNSADSGSGGGLRLQAVNGTDIPRFPNPTAAQAPFAGGDCTTQYKSGALNCLWYVVTITNNIINNNIAGWDGAGVSLEDALAVKLINNTISSNDTTASSGVLFNTLGAPNASSQSPASTCQNQNGGTVSCPQPAGLVTLQNSPQMIAGFSGIDANGQPVTGPPMTITCPPGNYQGGTATNGSCIHISYPALYNNLFWQNRAFQIGVGGSGTGQQNQQNVVTLFNAAFNGTVGSAAGSQSFTGACPTGASYWDIGVRNDTGPGNHGSGYTLNPLNGVLSALNGYSATNLTANPNIVSQYCNGSRVPPEAVCTSAAGQTVPCGWQVPPGIADAVVPNPVFTLSPAATVDEGNNWINISWGPLSMLNPVSSSGTTNVVLGNYALQSTSAAVDHDTCASTIPCVQTIAANGVTSIVVPGMDFFGNARPDPANANHFDIGAIEFQGSATTAAAPTLGSITPNTGVRGTTVNVTLTGTSLQGTTAVTLTPTGGGVTVQAFNVNSPTQITATFVISNGAALTARNVTVTTAAGTSNAVTFTVQGATLTSITPNSGFRGTTVPVTITGNNLTGATAVNVAGVTATITGTPTATTVTANFVIAAGATAGARNVTVSTPIGMTNAVSFTVNSPTLTSINPPAGVRGTTVPVTLSGTGLAGTTAITVSGPGVTVNTIVANPNGLTVTANFVIAPPGPATPGARTVTVTTNGVNVTIPFEVTGATLAISAPSPVMTTTPGNATTKNATITVANTATGAAAGPFTFTANPTLTPVGTQSGTFSIQPGGTCVSGFVINPGTNCSINVRYVPTTTATSTANVTVTGTGTAALSQTGGNFNAN